MERKQTNKQTNQPANQATNKQTHACSNAPRNNLGLINPGCTWISVSVVVGTVLGLVQRKLEGTPPGGSSILGHPDIKTLSFSCPLSSQSLMCRVLFQSSIKCDRPATSRLRQVNKSGSTFPQGMRVFTAHWRLHFFDEWQYHIALRSLGQQAAEIHKTHIYVGVRFLLTH